MLSTLRRQGSGLFQLLGRLVKVAVCNISLNTSVNSASGCLCERPAVKLPSRLMTRHLELRQAAMQRHTHTHAVEHKALRQNGMQKQLFTNQCITRARKYTGIAKTSRHGNRNRKIRMRRCRHIYTRDEIYQSTCK